MDPSTAIIQIKYSWNEKRRIYKWEGKEKLGSEFIPEADKHKMIPVDFTVKF